jgi:hypothetical protein
VNGHLETAQHELDVHECEYASLYDAKLAEAMRLAATIEGFEERQAALARENAVLWDGYRQMRLLCELFRDGMQSRDRAIEEMISQHPIPPMLHTSLPVPGLMAGLLLDVGGQTRALLVTPK